MTVTQLKEQAQANLDKKIIVSVIAAGAILSGIVYGLRKVGMGKVATVVAKVK